MAEYIPPPPIAQDAHGFGIPQDAIDAVRLQQETIVKRIKVINRATGGYVIGAKMISGEEGLAEREAIEIDNLKAVDEDAARGHFSPTLDRITGTYRKKYVARAGAQEKLQGLTQPSKNETDRDLISKARQDALEAQKSYDEYLYGPNHAELDPHAKEILDDIEEAKNALELSTPGERRAFSNRIQLAMNATRAVDPKNPNRTLPLVFEMWFGDTMENLKLDTMDWSEWFLKAPVSQQANMLQWHHAYIRQLAEAGPENLMNHHNAMLEQKVKAGVLPPNNLKNRHGLENTKVQFLDLFAPATGIAYCLPEKNQIVLYSESQTAFSHEAGHIDYIGFATDEDRQGNTSGGLLNAGVDEEVVDRRALVLNDKDPATDPEAGYGDWHSIMDLMLKMAPGVMFYDTAERSAGPDPMQNMNELGNLLSTAAGFDLLDMVHRCIDEAQVKIRKEDETYDVLSYSHKLLSIGSEVYALLTLLSDRHDMRKGGPIIFESWARYDFRHDAVAKIEEEMHLEVASNAELIQKTMKNTFNAQGIYVSPSTIDGLVWNAQDQLEAHLALNDGASQPRELTVDGLTFSWPYFTASLNLDKPLSLLDPSQSEAERDKLIQMLLLDQAGYTNIPDNIRIEVSKTEAAEIDRRYRAVTIESKTGKHIAEFSKYELLELLAEVTPSQLRLNRPTTSNLDSNPKRTTKL